MGRMVNGRSGGQMRNRTPKYLSTVPNKLLTEKYDDEKNAFSILNNEKRLKTSIELIQEYNTNKVNKKQKRGIKKNFEIPSQYSTSIGAPKYGDGKKIGTNDIREFIVKNKKRNKMCKRNPKNYYSLQSTKDNKESGYKKVSKKGKKMEIAMDEIDQECAANNQDVEMNIDECDSEMQHNMTDNDVITDGIEMHFNNKTENRMPLVSPEKNKEDKRVKVTNDEVINTNWVVVGKKKEIVSTNVGMFTTKKVQVKIDNKNMSTFPTIKEQNEIASKVPVREITKNVIMCRFKCKIEGNSCNLGLVVKQVVKLFRSADTALQIMPMKNNDCDKIIDHEDSLPTTKDELEEWVTNVNTFGGKIHFTMKMTTIKTIKAISGPVFDWMKKNKCYVKIDKINSDKIATAGFFEGFHPDFQNREEFKEYLKKTICSKTHLDDIELSVYPRAVYIGAGIEKIESRAVVIEVAANNVQYVLQAFSDQFEGNYEKVTFVPFLKVDDDYKQILQQAMKIQNKMLHSIKRKNVRGLLNIGEKLIMKDGKQQSIREWLLSAKHSGTNNSIITAVENAHYNTSNILFDGRDEKCVTELIHNIREQIGIYFSDESAKKVLSSELNFNISTENKSRDLANSDLSWCEMIKRKYLGNPQCSNDNIDSNININAPPTKQRKTIYYGSVTAPNKLYTESNQMEFASENNKSNESYNSSSKLEKIDELEKKVEKYMNELNNGKTTTSQHSYITQENVETMIKESLTTVEEKLYQKVQEQNNVMNEKFKSIEKSQNETMKIIKSDMHNLNDKFDRMMEMFIKRSTSVAEEEKCNSGKN